MTRWERLLYALGVTPATFDLEHQARFDLSPDEWLTRQLDALAREKPDLFRSVACKQACCQESGS